MNGSASPPHPSEAAPLLGQAVGTYRERAVGPALRPHFAGLWFHSVPPGAPARTLIVPDGSADLVWFGGTLRIAGPDRQAKLEAVPSGTTVIGLRFQPGAAGAWLEAPLSDVADARVPLECFWGPEARRISAWMGEAHSPEGIGRRLEHAMSLRAGDVSPPDGLPQAIRRALEEGPDDPLTVTRRLGASLGVAERTLRRRCQEAFGYGPKTLERIMRFQRALRLLRDRGALGLADLALAAGYADQPHLTREARRLSGLTPTGIREQLLGPDA